MKLLQIALTALGGTALFFGLAQILLYLTILAPINNDQTFWLIIMLFLMSFFKECIELFDTASGEKYKTRQQACFIDSNENQLERLQHKVARLESELEVVRLQLTETKSLEGKMLKRLKQLCHPDKHGNSALSNSVFSELNRF